MTGRTCVVLLVVLLGLGLMVSPVHASVSPFWQPLGGSTTGKGISQLNLPTDIFDVSVAVDANGRPVVTYAVFANGDATQGDIVVKRWTGSAWQTLSASVGQGYLPQVRLSPTGEIFVAWLQTDVNGNSEIHLRKYDGTNFVALGTSDSPGGITGTNPFITFPFSLAIDSNGRPIVAFLAGAVTGITNVSFTPALIDTTLQVYVRRWDGSAWQFVGSNFTGGGASNALSFKGTFGSDTVDLTHSVDMPTLTLDSSGAPVVAFEYVTQFADLHVDNRDIYVTRWNGSAWVAVGPAVPTSDGPAAQGGAGGVSNSDNPSTNPSIAALSGGGLALAWEEESSDGSSSYVWVRVWNGTNWTAHPANSATGTSFNKPNTNNTISVTTRVTISMSILHAAVPTRTR